MRQTFFISSLFSFVKNENLSWWCKRILKMTKHSLSDTNDEPFKIASHSNVLSWARESLFCRNDARFVIIVNVCVRVSSKFAWAKRNFTHEIILVAVWMDSCTQFRMEIFSFVWPHEKIFNISTKYSNYFSWIIFFFENWYFLYECWSQSR